MQYFIRKEGMPMLSIGIDVSKGKSTVCGMKPGGEIVYTPFEIQHTREGMSELLSPLRGSGEEVRAVLESIGSYHCPVVAALLENGIFVSVVNSLRMKRFCSQSIRRVKTDQIDAMQIALYGLAYWQELQPTKLPEDTYRELQLLARQYYQMTSLLIKAKVDFNAICDQVLPGMQELRTVQAFGLCPALSSHHSHPRNGRNALSKGLLQMGGKKGIPQLRTYGIAHLCHSSKRYPCASQCTIHADRHYGSDTSPPHSGGVP